MSYAFGLSPQLLHPPPSPMAIDILLIEELLASESLWQQSPPSLRAEATAMVAALVQDCAQIPDLQSAILLSPAAAASFRQHQLLPPQIVPVITNHGAADWLLHPSLTPESIRRLLILAPEFSSLLVDRLTAAQSSLWRQTQVLNLSSAMAALFSDKYATATWLRKHSLPTPNTWPLTSSARATLLDHSCQATPAATPKRRFVVKPRFGAGCDQVSLLQLEMNVAQQSQNSMRPLAAEADWILQRRARGHACSVSLIGQGTNRPAIILPPGWQRITRTSHGQLRYRGGQIPCEPDAAALIRHTASQFAAALGPFCGWLGIDLVVSLGPTPRRNSAAVQIIEINPRLCTSYIGYRRLTRENLVRHLLLLNDPAVPIRWLTESICFDADGGISQRGNSGKRSGKSQQDDQ